MVSNGEISTLFTKVNYSSFYNIGTGSKSASWSNAFISEVGGLRFKSRAGQIEHSVANDSPQLRRFFEKSCGARAQ